MDAMPVAERATAPARFGHREVSIARRRWRRASLLLGLLASCLVSRPAPAQTLTLPLDKRPAWVARDGIVMAGSWEPLVFRVRRDGSPGYTPTPEQRAAYLREHSPEMVAQLKALGVNFVMTHCYKGAGLAAEREGMADAVRFARLCREAGLRVGVYNYSGAFLWELFFKEVPQAEEWVVVGDKGKVTYGSAAYRYYWNRNHPDAQAYYRQIVRFAVNEIRADLVHFDNYSVGPGRDANSVGRFRQYLRETFAPEQLAKAGVGGSIETIEPPRADAPALLRYAWQDFSCQSMADSYYGMNRYARSLRPDVLVECNPLGVLPTIHPPIDHGRLLQGGEAYWDESGLPGYRNGVLRSRIRTCKVARRMNNMAFSYITTPLEAAESMAFNLDCLGAICWFEYGKVVERPGSTAPMSEKLRPYVRFFHQRRELFRGAEVVADAAVLRSFPSQVFGGPKHAQLTAQVEDALIESRVPFQILYDHQLGDLRRYRALVLAGCVALTDRQIEEIRRYAASGGRLCVIGPAATHDQWMNPRPQPALDDLPVASVVRINEKEDRLAAIRQACGGQFSLSIEPQSPQAAAVLTPGERRPATLPGLCAELTEQPNRRLVHLVNYRSDGPVKNVSLRLSLPAGRGVKGVTLASPEHDRDRPVPFSQAAGSVTFTVPEVGVYEIAVVTMQNLGVRAQDGSTESLSKMPPQRLAQVAPQVEKDPAIAWGEAQRGLAAGIGAVRTSLKSPIWPIIDAYLENRGASPIMGVVQGRTRFLLELDGRFYAESDFGGLSSRMAPGTRYGPIAVETMRFREAKRPAPFPVIGDNAPAPILTEGEHTLRLHYKLDRKLISSAPVTFRVSLSPYPEQEAVATIARELTHADSWVRGMAALAAKDLRLSGCRDALLRALEDGDGTVRRYSAEGLGELGDRAAVAPLNALLKDADMGVRLAAADSLVKLGEALDVAWVEPIIKSKHRVFQNAIWLVRRHGGERAVPTLIRCLDTEDPSVKSYYNYTLVWQIAACGGPRLRYHHDFDGKGTKEQVEENRKVLAQLQDWLHKHPS